MRRTRSRVHRYQYENMVPAPMSASTFHAGKSVSCYQEWLQRIVLKASGGGLGDPRTCRPSSLVHIQSQFVPLSCRYLPLPLSESGVVFAEIPTSPSKQYTSPSTRTFGVFKTISEYSPVVSTYTSPSWLFRVTLLNVSSLSTGFPETFVSPSKNHTAARDGPSVARARTLSRERR